MSMGSSLKKQRHVSDVRRTDFSLFAQNFIRELHFLQAQVKANCGLVFHKKECALKPCFHKEAQCNSDMANLKSPCDNFCLSLVYQFFLTLIGYFCHSLNVVRPAGIPVVPVHEEDEPSTRRKVQRITSPEKWELKQVNYCIHSQLPQMSYNARDTDSILFKLCAADFSWRVRQGRLP